MESEIEKYSSFATSIMKKYLVVTIDVEPDCSRSWHYSDPLEFKAIHVGIKQRLQPMFDKYQVVPTYLVNNVVLEDVASVAVLRHLQGKYELGAHLHPEFIEPAKKYEVYAGKRGEANCCFYPPEIETEKIRNITRLFEAGFGYKPTSFRAGRYSAGANTMSTLANLGYLVDSSITPHLCWDDKSMESPIDFRTAPEQPYLINENKITQEDGQGMLLEVPISIALIKRNVFKEFIVAAGGMRHEMRRYKPIWLRPFYSTADQMIMIARQFSLAYENRGQLVLNMMFHNVEILPGLSPYTKTEKECEWYLDQLKQFFTFCLHDNYDSVGLSELYQLYGSSGNSLT